MFHNYHLMHPSKEPDGFPLNETVTQTQLLDTLPLGSPNKGQEFVNWYGGSEDPGMKGKY